MLLVKVRQNVYCATLKLSGEVTQRKCPKCCPYKTVYTMDETVCVIYFCVAQNLCGSFWANQKSVNIINKPMESKVYNQRMRNKKHVFTTDMFWVTLDVDERTHKTKLVSYFILMVKQSAFSIMTLQNSLYPFIFVLCQDDFLILENYMKSAEMMNSVLKIIRYDNGIMVYFNNFTSWMDCKHLLKEKNVFYLW